MFTKVYWLKKYSNGAAVGIMSRPRGGDWLEDEVRNLKLLGVQTMVSLLEWSEIYELDLKDEERLCTKHGITYINFPIPDRGLPKDFKQVSALIDNLRDQVKQGISAMIHCRMGIGRSSIIAGAVMLMDGAAALDIIDEISKIRGLKVPDTDEQAGWLQKFE